MYTFNMFVYGHDFSKNKNLNNLIHEMDVDYKSTVNGTEFEISCPYHGGQVAGDTVSLIWGTVITDSDDNRNFASEIRNAIESDYEANYKEWLKEAIKEIEEMGEEIGDRDYNKMIKDIKKFVSTHPPEFYIIEASS